MEAKLLREIQNRLLSLKEGTEGDSMTGKAALRISRLKTDNYLHGIIRNLTVQVDQLNCPMQCSAQRSR